MKLGKIFVYFILTCTFILPSCSSQIVSQNILNDEIAFQDILVGKTTYADLQKLDLIPLKDIDISTLDNLTTKPMCGHYIQYEGFDIFVDDTVETINIYDNYSGQLFANFYIGDSLQVVVNKLPQAPKQYDISYDMSKKTIPLDQNYCAHLMVYYDENKILTKKILVIYPNEKSLAQFEFNNKDMLEFVKIQRL